MRDGNFTQIIYMAQTATLVAPAREACIMGVPTRKIEDKLLQSLHLTDFTDDAAEDDDTISIAVGADESNGIKTDAGDQVISVGGSNALNFDIKVRRAGESPEDAVSIFDSTLFDHGSEIIYAASNYGDDNAISISAENLLKKIVDDADAMTVVLATDPSNGNVVDVTGDDAEDFMALLEVGQYMEANDGTSDFELHITEIDHAANSFTVSGGPMDTGAVEAPDAQELSTYSIYWDYLGYTSSTDRAPKLSFDVHAKRTGKTGRYSINDYQDLVDIFDEETMAYTDAYLAYSALMYMASSGNSLKFTLVLLETTDDSTTTLTKEMDDTGSWTAALEIIKNVSPIYYIVPAVTKDEIETVAPLIQTHVDNCSDTEIKRERRAYIFRPILNEGSGYGESDTVGDEYLDTSYDSTADVEVAAGVPSVYADHRITLVGPYYMNKGDVVLEGPHIASIVCGHRSAADLGYVFTFEPFSEFTSSPALDYFSIAQKETLKDAGWYLLDQELVGGPVYCYHQFTTEQELLERKEESLTIAIDALAKTVRATLDPYIARGLDNRIGSNSDSAYNKRYIKKVNGALGLIKHYFVTTLGLFNDFSIVGIEQNTSHPDQVDTKLQVSHFYPVNRNNIKIYVI